MLLSDLKYVMVSVWNNWPTNCDDSYYTNNLIKCKVNKDKINMETLFINPKKKKAWLGYIRYKEKTEKRTYYDLKIEREETAIPEELKSQEIGWYLYPHDIQESQPLQDKSFEPPFFDRLRTTKDPAVFENDVYCLLRLIGIHDIKKYPQNKQAGRCDGEFIFDKIAVKYDATLNEHYKSNKKEQIKNYRLQLEGDERFEFATKNMDIKGKYKYVWIITRGISKFLDNNNNVIISEISIENLISLYHDRLNSSWTESELEEKLISLAK